MRNDAFTLLEMLTVFSVIAIITAMMIPRVMQGVEKTKVARVVEEARQIRNGAYGMYADTGLWPGSNWGDDAANDPLAAANAGDGFARRGNDPNMPSTWGGPYLEKWSKNPWGGIYWWDYNHDDQNGDGVGREHVLWIDNGFGNGGKRIPLKYRTRIDQVLDDGDLHAGTIQIWQGDDTNGNLGYILIQG